jgi:hypothetical protein
MKRALLLALACALSCTPDAEELCEDLDECPEALDFEDCVEDGERAEAAAEASGCEDLYVDYLECLDEDICSWPACSGARERLEDCAGLLANGAN